MVINPLPEEETVTPDDMPNALAPDEDKAEPAPKVYPPPIGE